MVAAGARTYPLRCFAIRVLSSDSCRRRNIMLFRYRLLPPSQHYALQISFRSRSERMPRERIAKHLSERAPTPSAAT